MRVAKTSQFIKGNQERETYLVELDKDIESLHTALQGRIRFGGGIDGERGENLSGEWQVFTTSATPDAENTIAHTLGSVPVGYIICGQDKAGSLYQLSDTGTAWTGSNIYLKCSVASITFKVFLLK
jgi:hypothetical protein